MKTGTKFWIAVGVESALLLVLALIMFTGNFGEAVFIAWLGAFVAVPTQYGILNVKASGQVSTTTNNVAGIPGS